MTVATLEFDVRLGAVDANTAVVLEAIARASSSGVELLAIPEMWPTSFLASPEEEDLDSSDRAVAQVVAAARDAGLVVVGSAYQRHAEPARLPWNRAHVIANGTIAAHHDKVHLFSPTAEHLGFSSGEAPPGHADLELRGSGTARVAPLICYDLRFPDVTRAAFRAGATVLVVVAQWPEARIAHWDALIRGRAVESQAFVIASNRVGTDFVGRRRMELHFPGHASVIAPSGERVEPFEDVSFGVAGSSDARLQACRIDLEEAHALRRLVPVAKDERQETLARWGAR